MPVQYFLKKWLSGLVFQQSYMYVSETFHAIILLAMKNTKKFFFLQLIYLAMVKRRNCLKLSFVSISMCIINVLKPARIFNCSTPFPLMSNVYKFSCLRDAKISYIGMTRHHLGIRVQEHLHHKTLRSPIKDHMIRVIHAKK